MPITRAEAACTVPNSISNGQVADATKVMDNFNALNDCVNSTAWLSGTPSAGELPVFSSSTAITGGDLSGDCGTTGSLATTCTKTNGVPFGFFATGTDAGQLTGTVPVGRFNNGVNADGTHFLRGDGVWASVPSGGGGGSTGNANWWAGNVPVAATFPVAFTGGGNPAAITDDADLGLIVKVNNAGNGLFTARGYGETLPASGPWDVEARIFVNCYNNSSFAGGVYLFEQGTNKLASIALVADTGAIYTDTYNGTMTGFTARGNRYNQGFTPVFVKIAYDGTTNYTFSMSITGKDWLILRTVAKTSVFTAGATHIGLATSYLGSLVSAANQSVGCDYWIQSW